MKPERPFKECHRGVLRAFTLVELLVVITIIGILIALLLPAVQAAREAARRAQCSNHLKQLSLGILNHESQQKHFPTGGFWPFDAGAWWIGQPEQGFGNKQYGGWFYNTLPFLEQQAAHDIGLGASDSQRRALWAKQVTVPMAIANCPSRRPPATYGLGLYETVNYWRNIDMPTGLAKIDYAINAGSTTFTWDMNPTLFSKHNGISYGTSLVTVAEVRDGTTNTYLLGEKYVQPDAYFTGLSAGDDNGMYCGHDWDICRYTYHDPANSQNSYRPLQDQEGVEWSMAFGSPHGSGFHMSFGDGSVRMMSYNVDLQVHAWLGNRDDGRSIDAKAF